MPNIDNVVVCGVLHEKAEDAKRAIALHTKREPMVQQNFEYPSLTFLLYRVDSPAEWYQLSGIALDAGCSVSSWVP